MSPTEAIGRTINDNSPLLTVHAHDKRDFVAIRLSVPGVRFEILNSAEAIRKVMVPALEAMLEKFDSEHTASPYFSLKDWDDFTRAEIEFTFTHDQKWQLQFLLGQIKEALVALEARKEKG